MLDDSRRHLYEGALAPCEAKPRKARRGKGADSSEHKEEKLLHRYLTEADATAMQPINANFGLLPPLPRNLRDRPERNCLLVHRTPVDFRA